MTLDPETFSLDGMNEDFLFCRSPGCLAQGSGSGEAGEGGTQAHVGGGPTEVPGPCGGEDHPAGRPEEPSK